MNDNERFKTIFKAVLLHSVCILFWLFLSVGIFHLLGAKEYLSITMIAYFLTGWVLYEAFLKKHSKSAEIQAILWCISTNPILYFPWKYDITKVAKLRIF